MEVKVQLETLPFVKLAYGDKFVHRNRSCVKVNPIVVGIGIGTKTVTAINLDDGDALCLKDETEVEIGEPQLADPLVDMLATDKDTVLVSVRTPDGPKYHYLDGFRVGDSVPIYKIKEVVVKMEKQCT